MPNRKERPSPGLQRLVEAYFADNSGCKGGLGWDLLKGDGSDRIFYRVRGGGLSVVAMEYPHLKILQGAVSESRSFFSIGSHLRKKKIPVPAIYRSQPWEGRFVLEDLGDITLQDVVLTLGERERLDLYMKSLDLLVSMQIRGAEGFDPTWCCQSPSYDRELMLHGESGYFLREFVRSWMGLSPNETTLWKELHWLADQASEAPGRWFLHRDFQSRNLMVKDGEIRVIDFQGGRFGPLQYDVAALLNDPYVGLDEKIKERLIVHYMDRLKDWEHFETESFLHYHDLIALHRNFQVLGAFAFLSRKKGRSHFEVFIPQAVRSLSRAMKHHPEWSCPTLRILVDEIDSCIVSERKGTFRQNPNIEIRNKS